MAKFSARPLGTLERIYRFVGGLRGVDDVELAGAIQLVHDVSDQAAMLRSLDLFPGAPWVMWQDVHVHAGAGTIYSEFTPGASLPAILPVGALEQDYTLLLTTISNICTTAAPNTLYARFAYPPTVLGNTDQVPVPMYYATSAPGITPTQNVGNVTNNTQAGSIERVIPWGARCVMRSTATAAGDVTWSWAFRLALRGTRP